MSCRVFFITLELNAPHNPRLEVIATNKIEFFSRTETKGLFISGSNEELKF